MIMQLLDEPIPPALFPRVWWQEDEFLPQTNMRHIWIEDLCLLTVDALPSAVSVLRQLAAVCEQVAQEIESFR